MTSSWSNPTRLWLNADAGEIPALVHGGAEELLIALLDVANVACGGHAGDDATMQRTVARCREHNVVVVAHPGYPDRDGFGRRRLAMPRDALFHSLLEQMRALLGHARAADVDVTALKPHGALYHAVDDDPATATVLADVVDAVADSTGARLPVLLQAAQASSSTCRSLLASRGIAVVGEVFADRGVDDTGRLLPRGTPGALLSVPEARSVTRTFAARFAAGARDFCTTCVHGDGADALALATAVRDELDSVFGPRSRG